MMENLQGCWNSATLNTKIQKKRIEQSRTPSHARSLCLTLLTTNSGWSTLSCQIEIKFIQRAHWNIDG